METPSTGMNSDTPKKVIPFVPADSTINEFTLRAFLYGIVLAALLGAANAYIGLKAGTTISAGFPAAVIAIALMRVHKGTVLEENLLRTTATVGESLVAGAIFTIPAFLISGIWQELDYVQSTIFMLVGGTLGVLFVIILRRTLVEESNLPYPEAIACAEITKAGQKGTTGASYVFGAMGLGAALEFLKNSRGYQIITDVTTGFFRLPDSSIAIDGKESVYQSGVYLSTPVASPALMSVGYIIGPRLAAIAWAGGAFAWLCLVPMAVFLNGRFDWTGDMEAIFDDVWRRQIRLIAIGAMFVGALHTLWGLRGPLVDGIVRAFKEQMKKKEAIEHPNRLQKDIPLGFVLAGILLVSIPVGIIYFYFTQNLVASIVIAIVMIATGFLFSAVTGYLVGIMGNTNNPISGLTLPSLIIAALLIVMFGLTGQGGVAAALGVAAVVCCALGTAGLVQDLKVGQLLGGTPWKMEVSNIMSVIITAFVLTIPMIILHKGTPGGIGGDLLSAPQAGLMATLAQGIVGGKMAWPLLIFGAGFALGLILIKSPSPTFIAVGMYLPFETTSAIFVGGLIKWGFDKIREKRKFTQDEIDKTENKGILLASGLVAGEAMTGVLLAALYLANVSLPSTAGSPWLGFLLFPLVCAILIFMPMRKRSEGIGSRLG
ncbi:MAG: putative oligopeptide transporter, family [Bacteroidetes bacterium]|nr:putative oligopeptide transporter, family [Bacteroidota bacterium]